MSRSRDALATCDAFYRVRLGDPGRGACGGTAGDLLHRALTRAAEFEQDRAPVRRPSLCHDDTPLVYSARIGGHSAGPYRLLVEPGGLHRTTSAQIGYSLSLVDALLRQLSWCGASAAINAVTTSVIDDDASCVDQWWGGIWLGASVPRADQRNEQPDLRLYLNLRHGRAEDRWERIGKAFARLGAGSRENGWWRDAASSATPIGLALAIAGGELKVLRVYAVVPEAMIRHLCVRSGWAEGQERLDRFHQAFAARFGAQQSVTVGWDFRISRAIQPSPVRVKVDLCCQVLGGAKAEVVPWLSLLLRTWHLPTSGLAQFVRDLESHWRGFDPEFVGLDASRSGSQLTFYAKPHV